LPAHVHWKTNVSGCSPQTKKQLTNGAQLLTSAAKLLTNGVEPLTSAARVLTSLKIVYTIKKNNVLALVSDLKANLC
jgi:hypothetical protein